MPRLRDSGRHLLAPSRAISLAIVLLAVLLSVDALPGKRDLGAGEEIVRELTAGEQHGYLVQLAAGSWRVVVDQHGVDVEVDVISPIGEPLGAVDSPLDRHGLETVLIDVESAGEYEIAVRAREAAAPAGSYRIRMDPLTSESSSGEARLLAERAATRAARRYLSGSSEDLRRATDHYLEAAGHWATVGDVPRQARARYCAAVLYRLNDENAAAIAAGREVLDLWQALQDRSWEANTRNEIGLNLWHQGEISKARELFDQALTLHRDLGDAFGEAVALSNLCLMDLSRGELRSGLACYLEALPLLHQSRAPVLEGAARSNVGRVYNIMGEPELALEQYLSALDLMRSTGNARGEANTLNSLAVLHRGLGETQQALLYYGQALEAFRKIEDRRGQARAFTNLGLAYDSLGEARRGLSYLTRALEIWRELGDSKGEATCLTNLGLVRLHLQDSEAALMAYREALSIQQTLGDRRGEAIVRSRMSRVLVTLGDLETARAEIGVAVEILRQAGDRSNLIVALRRQGEILAGLDQLNPAFSSLEASLVAARELQDAAYEAEALVALARVERRLGRNRPARSRVEAAIGILEGLRSRIARPDLRGSYLSKSSRHEAYELQMDLLMEAHREAPATGFDRQAIAVSERARARALLDLLAEAQTGFRGDVEPALLERQRSLERRLAAKVQRALRSRERDPATTAELEGQQEAILRELDSLAAQIRQESPSYAALTEPRPLSVAEIQQLLDPETVLLSFALGEARSYLWWVTTDGFASFELPPRSQIEASARRFRGLVGTFDVAARREGLRESEALGELLLGPVAAQLDRRRIAIVADGALHYVPFGALRLPPSPDSVGGQEPRTLLLERHEIVYLPSASTLAALRQGEARRRPAAKWLAVFADPVFEADDPRITAAADEASAPLPGQLVRGADSGTPVPRFARLRATRREAEAISKLATAEVAVALDFEANRRRVLDATLADYHIVHFATHGVIDSEHPARSGLALSLVDRVGRPQEGFLGLRDIYNLRLGADLVVLSGCQTALGRQLRGEGLVGLTRGFMYAGAKRVVASLWQVEDRATAELMARFYRSMQQDGVSATSALRTAQLAIRQERRWRDPYFWAGFVLLGDWR